MSDKKRATRVLATGKDGRRVYVWRVEFQVSETWVEDGFDLTDERALSMLSRDLGYANIETELGARVLASPNPTTIAKASGEG